MKQPKCLHNAQTGRLKDGGEAADVKRRASLSGDEKNTAEIKGCAPGIHPRHWSFHHCCLHQEGKCLQFLVTYGVMNEGRQGGKIERGEWSEEEEEKTCGGEMGCYAEDNKSMNNGTIKGKEDDGVLCLRNRPLCRSKLQRCDLIIAPASGREGRGRP